MDSKEFFLFKHNTLKQRYHHEDGGADSCSLIATVLAVLLKKEGRKPFIVYYRGKLVPLPYKGLISWGGHTVCVCDNLAWDPVLEEPIPLKNYSLKMFGKQVKPKTDVAATKINKLIERVKNNGYIRMYTQ